jgi:hypothetical protein
MKTYLIKSHIPGFPEFSDCVKAFTALAAKEVWQAEINIKFANGKAVIQSVEELT